MSILDSILSGGGESTTVNETSTDVGTDVSAAPAVGVALSDVLALDSASSDGDGGMQSTSLTGLGGAAVGVTAPVELGLDGSIDQYSASQQDGDGGGLLGGLL